VRVAFRCGSGAWIGVTIVAVRDRRRETGFGLRSLSVARSRIQSGPRNADRKEGRDDAAALADR